MACFPYLGACEKPVATDTIVDSVGVDLHLHYNDTPYGNFPLIKGLLISLGVRHVRDGLADTKWQPYYQEFIELGKAGIKGIFLTSPNQTDAFITTWPKRVPGAFEGYEGPNEYDNSGDPHWADTLKVFMPRLYRAVKADPDTRQFPVIGPSLIHGADFKAIAQLSPDMDEANMHNYFGGRNPGTPGWGDGGYGSIAYNIDLTNVWPNHPIVTTETGYNTGSEGIPEEIEGTYEPRVILEQALHGVRRTYLYELIDEPQLKEPKERDFGLVHGDGSPKPAFTALKNLLGILADPGPVFMPAPLPFSLTGGSKNFHHLLMARRDGSYYLALWLETEDFDVNRRIKTPATPEQVTFHSEKRFSSAQLMSFHPDGSMQTSKLTPGTAIPLTATDCVAILKLK